MIGRHSQNMIGSQAHSNISDQPDCDPMTKMIGGHKSSKDKASSRSGSGIPSNTNLQRVGGVNSVINNISCGIAQKK